MKNSKVNEDIVNLNKEKRSESEAKSQSATRPIKDFNPLSLLVKLHKNGKVAAKNALKKELGKQKDIGEDAVIKFSNSCIKNGGKDYVQPEDGKIVIGIYITTQRQKGFFKRLFTGDMANWFKKTGVIGMQAYVSAFAGADIGKQISDNNVFNGIGEGNHEGRTAFYTTLQMPTAKDTSSDDEE